MVPFVNDVGSFLRRQRIFNIRVILAVDDGRIPQTDPTAWDAKGSVQVEVSLALIGAGTEGSA